MFFKKHDTVWVWKTWKLKTQESTVGFMFPCLILTFFQAFWRRNMQYHDPHIEMCAFYKWFKFYFLIWTNKWDELNFWFQYINDKSSQIMCLQCTASICLCISRLLPLCVNGPWPFPLMYSFVYMLYVCYAGLHGTWRFWGPYATSITWGPLMICNNYKVCLWYKKTPKINC